MIRTDGSPDAEHLHQPGEIFVFGSNTAGIHGAGAARTALLRYGAQWRRGHGHYGSSYAIPTKDHNIQTLPLDQIAPYVGQFLQYATAHPTLRFFLTRIGCGLAGYQDAQIAPMFHDAPPNVRRPPGW